MPKVSRCTSRHPIYGYQCTIMSRRDHEGNHDNSIWFDKEGMPHTRNHEIFIEWNDDGETVHVDQSRF